MKIRVWIVCLLAVLVFTGCSVAQVEEKLDSMENALENQFSPTPGASDITREQAQETALKHAQLTAQQVTGLRTEYEIDDGKRYYEVQFRQDSWEYDYEIDAATGEILSWDKEQDRL